jgi:hypothetical protein
MYVCTCLSTCKEESKTDAISEAIFAQNNAKKEQH